MCAGTPRKSTKPVNRKFALSGLLSAYLSMLPKFQGWQATRMPLVVGLGVKPYLEIVTSLVQIAADHRHLHDCHRGT